MLSVLTLPVYIRVEMRTSLRAATAAAVVSLIQAQFVYTGFTISSPDGFGMRILEQGGSGAIAHNVAREAATTVFATDSIAGYAYHVYGNVRDGVYGNVNSWIGNTDPGTVGYKFGGNRTIWSVAWGRDNTNAVRDNRVLGIYKIQFTQLISAGNVAAATENSATGWATISTVTYTGADAGSIHFSNQYLRHRYTFQPLWAVGVRMIVDSPTASALCIDELEVFRVPDASYTPSGISLSADLTLVEQGPVAGTVPSVEAGNIAREGATAVSVSSTISGYYYHKTSGLNDGVYSNYASWISGGSSPSWAGYTFGGGLRTISGVAFGRDNSPMFEDRTFGTYTIEYTQSAAVAFSAAANQNAATGWKTIGTITYSAADRDSPLWSRPSVRHRYAFTPVRQWRSA